MKAFRSLAGPGLRRQVALRAREPRPGSGAGQALRHLPRRPDRRAPRPPPRPDHHQRRRSGAVQAFNPAGQTYTLSCAAGQIPVAPGFKFHASLAAGVGPTAHGPIYISYPTSSELGWQWSFGPRWAGRLGLPALHQRDHHVRRQPGAHPQRRCGPDPRLGRPARGPSAGQSIDRTISSRAHDEGNVGGFWIDNPTSTFYLGQDARGQVRTTRFWASGADNAWLLIWGFDKRTSRQPGALIDHDYRGPDGNAVGPAACRGSVTQQLVEPGEAGR